MMKSKLLQTLGGWRLTARSSVFPPVKQLRRRICFTELMVFHASKWCRILNINGIIPSFQTMACVLFYILLEYLFCCHSIRTYQKKAAKHQQGWPEPFQPTTVWKVQLKHGRKHISSFAHRLARSSILLDIIILDGTAGWDFISFLTDLSKKSPTVGPTERTPKKPEYLIARSQLT